MVQSFVYNTDEGQPFVYDAALAYANLLFCSREGVEFDVVTSNNPFEIIGSRQVQHSLSFGYLKFPTDFNSGEKIQIIISEL